MKVNHIKINELCESWLNGNKSYVRGKVKNMNKVEFVLLCAEITNLTDNVDIDQVAFQLTTPH